MALVWLQFFLCLAVIAMAGYKLCRYADVIAEKSGLSSSLIGVVLLATVTSLPELASGISSVTIAQVPDIAAGNILGACLLNLLFIAVLDFLLRGESIYRRVSTGHILTAAFGMILTAYIGMSMLVATQVQAWRLAHIGVATPVVLLFYCLAMYMIHRFERGQMDLREQEQAEQYASISFRRAILGYALSALLVVLAALWLPFVARQLAEVMGWAQSFVGTMLVAAATTVPEAAVTLSALRIGAFDMAIANLLGSNLFNLMILAIDDLFYMQGPFWAAVSGVHVITAFVAVMMGGVVVLGLFLRPGARLFHTVGWASLALIALYTLNGIYLYLSPS